jgi:hypothetical protein
VAVVDAPWERMMLLRAGELARVVIIGDGDTDLDLHVNDRNGT